MLGWESESTLLGSDRLGRLIVSFSDAFMFHLYQEGLTGRGGPGGRYVWRQSSREVVAMVACRHDVKSKELLVEVGVRACVRACVVIILSMVWNP